MNAESAKRQNRVVSKEFYDFVEKFHNKCLSGKKISAEDISAFYDVISSTKKETSKNIAHATLIEPSLADKTSKILHQLQKTIGQSKEMIESVSKTIPYQHIETALDSLTLYVDELKKKSRSVSRKDSDIMPHSQGEN